MSDVTFDFGQLEPLAPLPAVHGGDPLAAVQLEAELLREQARVDGYEAGRREGFEAARAEAEPAMRAIATALEEMRRVQEESVAQLEHDALDLALRIAEKALAGAVAVDPTRVMDVVAGALRGVVDRQRVVVLVNPEDLELVRESVDRLVGSLGAIAHLDVQGERRVARGGAVVRTDEGEVDATLDTKLERAREALEEELRGGAAES